MTIWICRVCGYREEDEQPPEICPDCGASREAFLEL